MKCYYLSIFLLVPVLSAKADTEKPTKKEVALIHHWLANTSENRIHQLRGARDNKVFLHKDGHIEVVYNGEGNLVKDGINDGSYNYAHPIKEPLKHFNQDILPWILWGNSRKDPTTVKERLEAYSQDLSAGLSRAQVNHNKKFKRIRIKDSERMAAEFFLRVLKEGEVESILQIIEDPDFKVKKPHLIGKGLTKGLISVIKTNQFIPTERN